MQLEICSIAERNAPIIVTAQLQKADQLWADGLRRRHYPPERNHLPAHITLFHHLAPSLETELRTLLKSLSAAPRPSAHIDGALPLGNGVMIGLTSPGLLLIWHDVARRFERYLIPQDRHPPRLHITVQNKVSAAVADATLADVRASLVPRASRIAEIACWHYQGGPWSLISRHGFRG